eukprot:370414_1
MVLVKGQLIQMILNRYLILLNYITILKYQVQKKKANYKKKHRKFKFIESDSGITGFQITSPIDRNDYTLRLIPRSNEATPIIYSANEDDQKAVHRIAPFQKMEEYDYCVPFVEGDIDFEAMTNRYPMGRKEGHWGCEGTVRSMAAFNNLSDTCRKLITNVVIARNIKSIRQINIEQTKSASEMIFTDNVFMEFMDIATNYIYSMNADKLSDVETCAPILANIHKVTVKISKKIRKRAYDDGWNLICSIQQENNNVAIH